MRLLYLTRSYTGHDARWLRVLAGQGIRLAYLPLQAVDEAAFECEHPEVELLSTPGLPAVCGTAQLDDVRRVMRLQIRSWNADVILAGPLTDAGYLAAHIAPEKTLLMCWAFDVLHEAKLDFEAGDRLRKTLSAARHLFTDCRSLLAECELLAQRTFPQVCVLPWGLDEADKPEPRLGWRKRLGDERAKVVISPRGFSPVHRPEVVIETFGLAYARNPNLRLWLAGSGGLRERAERVADALALRSVVRFLGALDQADLAGGLAEADVYLSCADSDGTSISLLQAMHAGLPCVVTDLPGNREWLESAGGWFAPSGQVEAYASAVTEATALSPDHRVNIACAHRTRVSQRADLTANLPRLLGTFETIARSAQVPLKQLLAV